MPPQKAAKTASATAAVGGRDDISNLPDGPLQHMLSFLPAQDAVRTCVLAKRWRHMWKSTTSLRFVCGDRTKEEIEFVDQRLRLRIREDTPLDMCEFRVRLDDYTDDEVCINRILLWIRIALQCKVRVLRLISIAQFEGVIRSLDNHPFFISQYLKYLELKRLGEYPDSLLDFSCCPNLEELKIDQCYLAQLDCISSQSLKRLTIQRCSFTSESDWRRVPIRAPNLVSLLLDVGDGVSPSLERMPSLLTAFIKIDNDEVVPLESDDDSNKSILLQGLSEVQNLVLLSSHDDMFIFRRDLKFCSGFNKLKSLLIDEYWCWPADFSTLACLLKLAPVLEKLTLQLYSKGPNHKVEIKLNCKPREISTEISQHLKTLEVNCEVYDKRVRNVLTFLSKKLNIWFQFNGEKAMHENGPTIT